MARRGRLPSPLHRPRLVIFWIKADIVIAALIVSRISWPAISAGVTSQTNVPMTPGYAPAISTGAHLAVPANGFVSGPRRIAGRCARIDHAGGPLRLRMRRPPAAARIWERSRCG